MKTVSFSKDWKFVLGDVWCEEKAAEVCLPHTVALTPEISSGCRNYQGKCIYKKSFFAEEAHRGEKAILEFEGAMGVSQLYLNGELIKEHFCGYTPLVADISDRLLFGEENLVEVRLDNSDNPEVPPGKNQDVLDFLMTAVFTETPPLPITVPFI